MNDPTEGNKLKQFFMRSDKCGNPIMIDEVGSEGKDTNEL